MRGTKNGDQVGQRRSQEARPQRENDMQQLCHELVLLTTTWAKHPHQEFKARFSHKCLDEACFGALVAHLSAKTFTPVKPVCTVDFFILMNDGRVARRTVDADGKPLALSVKLDKHVADIPNEGKLRAIFRTGSVGLALVPDPSVFPLVVSFQLTSRTPVSYTDCLVSRLGGDSHDTTVMVRAMERISFMSPKGDFRVDCTRTKQYRPHDKAPVKERKDREQRSKPVDIYRYEVEVCPLRVGPGILPMPISTAKSSDLFNMFACADEPSIDPACGDPSIMAAIADNFLYNCFSLVLNVEPELMTCRLSRRQQLKSTSLKSTDVKTITEDEYGGAHKAVFCGAHRKVRPKSSGPTLSAELKAKAKLLATKQALEGYMDEDCDAPRTFKQ